VSKAKCQEREALSKLRGEIEYRLPDTQQILEHQ
jgi:hypothetical protein